MLLSRAFHTGIRLSNYSKVNLTLFSKANCGLCDKAKYVLNEVTATKGFESVKIQTVDIDDPKNKEWWTKYCLDVPVLHIENTENPESLSKIFHKLEPEQVKTQVRTAAGAS